MKLFPLSNAQTRIWYMQTRYAGSSLFAIGGTVSIGGNIDMEHLRKAIIRVIRRHDALRFRFTEREGTVFQYVSSEIIEPDVLDFSRKTNAKKEYEAWSCSKTQELFQMRDAPMYYFAICKISEGETVYFVKLHHLIADGWAMKLLTHEISRFYEDYVLERQSIEPQAPSYIEYIRNEEWYLQSEQGKEAKKFWNHQMKQLPDCVALQEESLEGERKTVLLDQVFRGRIETFLQTWKVSMNTLFVCVYILYQYKISGSAASPIGIPFLGRTGRRERQTFGTFTNPMPFCYTVNANERIEQLLRGVQAALGESLRHQKYPYNHLRQDLMAQGEQGDSALYDTCINYYNTELSSAMAGYPIQNHEFYNGEQGYALQIIIRHWETDRLQLDYDYRMSRYTSQQMEMLHSRMMRILSVILDNPERRIKDFSLLTDQEQERMLDIWNRKERPYPKDKTFLDLFQANVLRDPNRVAVSHERTACTYEELDRWSDAVAYRLIKFGVKPGDVLPFIPDYTIGSIAVILGIMKSCAVYLPLDRKTPEERMLMTLENCRAKFLISEEFLVGFAGAAIAPKMLISTPLPCIRPVPKPSAGNIAYLIYTSGSTGRPKGVPIKHQSLLNYLCWANDVYPIREREVFPLFSSFAFDFTLTSIFLPLACGGEIRIYESLEEERGFQSILAETGNTILKITPSHIPLLLDARPDKSNLHTIVVGGENLTVEACRRLHGHFHGKVRIFNEYGPTEATIGCMTYQYTGEEQGASVPIGVPIANTEVYVLDGDLQPVPPGVPGEILISGDCIADGYIALDEETKARFLEISHLRIKRCYKTGDRAMRNDKDELVFLGRIDDEIKIRGHRVSITEIENRILASGLTDMAAVKEIQLENGTRQLWAYIRASKGDEQKALQGYLKRFLPEYMMPANYVAVERFVLTGNGKIDRRRLPDPVSHRSEQKQVDVEIWPPFSEVLKTILCVDAVSEEDNFYGLGGDSIKAIQISSRLREKGYELSVRDILLNPEIKAMVDSIKPVETQHKEKQGEVVEGTVATTPIMAWFFDQKFEVPGHYNQTVLLELKQRFAIEQIADVFTQLVRHHDALRLNVKMESREIFVNPKHLESRVEVDYLKLEQVDSSMILRKVQDRTDPVFDLEMDLLLRVYYIQSASQVYLYIIIHHLCIDGVSWRILLDDLALLLKAVREGRKVALPEVGVSFQEYARRYVEYLKSTGEEKQNDAVFRFKGEGRHSCRYGELEECRFTIDAELTKRMMALAKDPHGTKIQELLLIAFIMLLKRVYGYDRVICEIEGHGRDVMTEVDTRRTVGWLTNVKKVQVDYPGGTISEQIRALKEAIRCSGAIVDECQSNLQRYGYRENQGYIRFNYLGEVAELNSNSFIIHELNLKGDVSDCNEVDITIEFNAMKAGKELKIWILYPNKG